MADINWPDLPVLLLSREFLKQEKQLIENELLKWRLLSEVFIAFTSFSFKLNLNAMFSRHDLHLGLKPQSIQVPFLFAVLKDLNCRGQR